MPNTPVPWSFVIAVSVDAFVDGLYNAWACEHTLNGWEYTLFFFILLVGFLSGLSFHAKPIAGYIMAGATCIEMGFLGITFVGTLQASASRFKLAAICFVPLVTMLFGGFLSGVIGEVVRPGTAVFEGLIAFCIVALLFLVTQELLAGAHENLEGKEIVWVNMMIFLGILIVIAVERITASLQV